MLAIAAIQLILSRPTELGYASAAYSAVAGYLLYAVAVFWVVDRNLMKLRRVGFYTQALDTVWFPVILTYTHSDNSPFFLYYVFSLITASFRWGFRETLFVNTANVGMYTIVYLAKLNTDFGFLQFWVRPTYLYVLACLIGYLGEHQKKAQNQLLTLAELSSSIRVRDRFSRMLEKLMERVRQLFQVEQCFLVFHDEDSHRYLLKRTGAKVSYGFPRTVELRTDEAEFLLSPRSNWGYLINPSKRISRIFGMRDTCVYDFDSQKSVSQVFQPSKRLTSIFEARSMLSVPLFINAQFKGRVYLINKASDDFSNSDLQYLALIVSQVGPLLENYRLLKRMQTLSVLEEKNRIARDLHDGFLQSMASLDLRIQVCRQLSKGSSQQVEHELTDLQRMVQAEYDQLRKYMKQLKTPSMSKDSFVSAMCSYVEAFEKETGIRVNLFLKPDSIDLPRKVTAEISHMIHEGLTNVKRHALGAKQVSIGLYQRDTAVHLVISDDGRGFPMGTKKEGVLEREGPWSIRERTRALKGTLAVESEPEKGSTLHIQIPLVVEDERVSRNEVPRSSD